MSEITALFASPIWRSTIADAGLLGDLALDCEQIATDDRAGQRWSEKNGYPGYTSYASLADLPKRSAAIAKLVKQLDKAVAAFGKSLEFDLGRGKLTLDALWINVLEPGGFHTGHIHPNAVISGTVYVVVPDGASAIRFEDPRLPMMMAHPPRKPKSTLKPHVSFAPEPGTLLLWESFLRHEVPLNRAESERVSISFNYAWV
jgi:uncharacterized protein (TIGR02466 family)